MEAIDDVPNLSYYYIGIANDGNSDGPEIALPQISINKGESIIFAQDANWMRKYHIKCDFCKLFI